MSSGKPEGRNALSALRALLLSAALVADRRVKKANAKDGVAEVIGSERGNSGARLFAWGRPAGKDDDAKLKALKAKMSEHDVVSLSLFDRRFDKPSTPLEGVDEPPE